MTATRGKPVRRGRAEKVGSRHGDLTVCPCGTPAEFDSIDGWQHRDGSVSHDGDFYGKSVSDLIQEHQPMAPAPKHTAAWTPPPTRLPNGDHVGSYGDAGSGGEYHEMLGAHHGETGEYSGHLSVNSLGTEHHVQFMEVPEHLRGRGTMTGLVEHYKKHCMQPGDTLHWGYRTDLGDQWINKHGARFTPDKRVFTHTDGLDHRLFDGEHLRPEVRSDVLGRFTAFCAARGYREWSKWGRLVFFGSEASEWTSPSLEGNGDFDLSLGVDYPTFRQHNPACETMTDQEIAQMFTRQMHADLNDPQHYFAVTL